MDFKLYFTFCFQFLEVFCPGISSPQTYRCLSNTLPGSSSSTCITHTWTTPNFLKELTVSLREIMTQAVYSPGVLSSVGEWSRAWHRLKVSQPRSPSKAKCLLTQPWDATPFQAQSITESAAARRPGEDFQRVFPLSHRTQQQAGN